MDSTKDYFLTDPIKKCKV